MASGAVVNLTEGKVSNHVLRMLGPFSIAVIALISTGIVDTIYLGNLINIFAALSERDAEAVCLDYEGRGFAEFKRDLADLSVSVLGPITEEMARLMNDKTYLDSILSEGANNANKLASPILKQVQEIVGFLRP